MILTSKQKKEVELVLSPDFFDQMIYEVMQEQMNNMISFSMTDEMAEEAQDLMIAKLNEFLKRN